MAKITKADEFRFSVLLDTVKERTQDKIAVILDVSSSIALATQLRLALSHPDNNGRPAEVGRIILDNIISRLDHHAPGIGDMIRGLDFE